MNRLTNGFAKLSDAQLEVKAQFIITQMDNAYFPTPDPALGDLQDALTDFKNAVIAAKTGNRLDAAIKTQKRDALVDLLHLEANYVQFIAKGDVVKLMTSGFTLAKQPAPAPGLTKPVNLK